MSGIICGHGGKKKLYLVRGFSQSTSFQLYIFILASRLTTTLWLWVAQIPIKGLRNWKLILNTYSYELTNPILILSVVSISTVPLSAFLIAWYLFFTGNKGKCSIWCIFTYQTQTTFWHCSVFREGLTKKRGWIHSTLALSLPKDQGKTRSQVSFAFTENTSPFSRRTTKRLG